MSAGGNGAIDAHFEFVTRSEHDALSGLFTRDSKELHRKLDVLLELAKDNSRTLELLTKTKRLSKKKP